MKINLKPILVLLVSLSASAEISSEGFSVKGALENGKSCSATWSNESSKAGETTDVFDVRELNGMTQYQVYHSPENPRIWTWDYRLENIACH